MTPLKASFLFWGNIAIGSFMFFLLLIDVVRGDWTRAVIETCFGTVNFLAAWLLSSQFHSDRRERETT